MRWLFLLKNSQTINIITKIYQFVKQKCILSNTRIEIPKICYIMKIKESPIYKRVRAYIGTEGIAGQNREYL